MDKVLVQEKIYTRLNADYVSIKINLDSQKDIARKYRVSGIPALLFLDSQGNLLKRVNGYVPADYLAATLKSIE